MKMKKMELMGCLSRIRNCSVDILTLEEIVNQKQEEEEEEEEEEEMWDLIKRELQLKTTFLYLDLNRVISSSKDEEHKEVVTKLANQFFHCIQKLTDAVKCRSVPSTQLCFNDTADVLHEIMDALVPSPSY